MTQPESQFFRRLQPVKKRPEAIAVSPLLLEAAKKPAADVVASLQSSPQGLSSEEVERRIDLHGANVVAQEKPETWQMRLLKTTINPLVILLTVLAIISFAQGETDSISAGIIMTLMVILGVTLRFVQESRADSAAARLKAMISVTATVLRDGQTKEIQLKDIVPGDIVVLAAGDMIPADIRLLTSKDLFIIQASLTGESLPVEKSDAVETKQTASAVELSNVCFLGTSVESGSATAVVVATGDKTYFGSMASSIVGQAPQTSFDKGINRFTWLMIQFMAVMVPLVFLINGLTKHDWGEAFFFSLSIAVGLTPEMLPMIVSVGLSKGALSMSRKKVIVKRLNSIQNLGAMDVLCTDKTGTLTMDKVILERYCDVVRDTDDGVLTSAFLISHFQTGLRNVLDRAILAHEEVRAESRVGDHAKIDEIPFDFSRRIMSVVVKMPEGKRRLLTKGAPEEIFRRCTRFELNGEVLPMEQVIIYDLQEEYENLSADGFRVLAVAYKDVPEKNAYSKEDECDLVLQGYVAFLDPPKDSAAPAIAALQRHGVAVKCLTGDNALVTRKVCGDVGLATENMLVGQQVEAMNDAQLAEAAEKTVLFARLSPAHKQRIIKALQSKGHVVGFMGDGINDAPALCASDVGISVDTAVDIAKESADLILLEKSLMVLEEGILDGRKVFANILKYIRMGASSSFGNMFSVVGASYFLPFLPMKPIQLLTNNLLYDFSQVPIPADDVDEEQITKPRPWAIGEIRRFILFIGPISSIFDYTTFFVMLYVFKCWLPGETSEWIRSHNMSDFPNHFFDPTWLTEAIMTPINQMVHKERLFQTGWFVESLMTQTLIIHVIRTNKIPFIQSRASWPLIVTSSLIMAVGCYLPFSPIAEFLGLTALPPLYWPILLVTLLSYITLTQLIKTWLIKKLWI